MLTALGLQEWNIEGSLLVLAVLAAWTYRNRHADLWLLLGVTALVARLSSYHSVPDDSLIVLSMVTLFRIAKRDPSGSGVMAGVFLAITVLVMLAPARMHFVWPSPWPALFSAGHAVVWIGVLIFLLDQTRREIKTS